MTRDGDSGCRQESTAIRPPLLEVATRLAMSCDNEAYRLLVAHNYLTNISLDGSYDDTVLRIFKQRGLPQDILKCVTTLNDMTQTAGEHIHTLDMSVRRHCSSHV